MQNDKLFLDTEEVITLAGKSTKAAQIVALRKMGVAFMVNAAGVPIVPRPQFLGGKAVISAAWKPSAILTS